jgi:hypothetical protein
VWLRTSFGYEGLGGNNAPEGDFVVSISGVAVLGFEAMIIFNLAQMSETRGG